MKRPVTITAIIIGVFCLMFARDLFAQSTEKSKGYVNAREFANSLNLGYRWFPMQKMLILSRGTTIMKLFVDRNEAVLDNNPINLPSQPVLEEGQILIPARPVLQAFGSSPGEPKKPLEEPAKEKPQPPEKKEEIDPDTPATEEGEEKPPTAPKLLPTEKQPVEDEDKSILTSVRHSKREDKTRVVLEFDGPISFSSEMTGKNKFKLKVDGCKNIFPTKRSNPVGRDVKSMAFNSGPNRQGLVLSFDLPDGATSPVIETVADPYRIVLSFMATPEALAAASASALLTASQTAVVKQATASSPIGNATAAASIKKGAEVASQASKIASEGIKLTGVEPEAIPDVVLDVPLGSLTRSVFSGRLILIDPGHGGNDSGAVFPGLITEKQITLNVGVKLKHYLKQAGLNAFLIRSKDIEMLQPERNAIANRTSGDLLVSLHVGSSLDDSLEGSACYHYDPTGVVFDIESGMKLSAQLVYQEWCKSYRFDLAKFLAGKIGERMAQQLAIKNRGTKALPLSPLRFLVVPSVLVEIGMLSNQNEGKKLSTNGFQDAVARSICNGVLDFFNSIKLSQE